MRRVARALRAQTAMEVRLTTRRGENLVVTLVLPLLLLIVLGSNAVFGLGGERGVDDLVPGIIAMAIMSTGLVSLGIATAYERYYGVLKRLGGTPLTRSQLVAAKMAAVILVEVVQVGLIVAVAAALFAWRPAGNLPAALGLALLGTAAFAGVGLALAGALRAEAVLALANGLYLVLLLTGGFFLPISQLPPVVAALAPWLPAAALSESLRAAMVGAPVSLAGVAVLAAWAAGSATVAALTFRWE